MEWKTRLTELLGCKYPIMEGAFAGFGTSALAGPVSEAGGFGMITASCFRTPQGLRDDIKRCRQLTGKPFGVNLSVGVCPHIDEMREVCIEEGIGVVETSSARADDHGRRLREAGVKWVHKVATVRHAMAAAEQGADAVIIVGMEGIGFKSIEQIPTLVSITWAARKIKIPIVAAGGIADARGFLAAFAMGAEGVCLGTAFMATKECPISEKFKQSMVNSDPGDAKIRERVLAPPRQEEYEWLMKKRGEMSSAQFLQSLDRIMLKQSPKDIYEGWMYDVDEVLRFNGPSLAVATIDRVLTAKELLDSIVQGAEDILRTWPIAKMR